MSTISEISIEGFKSIAAIKGLRLRSLNLLIGANGSGKSNFIGAIKLLRSAIHGSVSDHVERVGGADRLLHFGAKVTSAIQFDVSLDDTSKVSVAMRHGADDQLFDRLSFTANNLPSDFPGNREIRDGVAPQLEFLRDRVDCWKIYHFHDTGGASPMKKTVDVDDNRHLRSDGSNLAAFLFLLRKQHRDAYKQIRRTVQLVAPFFEDFALKPSALNEDKIRLEWKHWGSDAYFNASSLSDGTLRFIALAALLLQPESLRPPVVLLDEPELGLHPSAVTLLGSLLKNASATSQIIAATQSSLLLDHFDPEDVLVAERVNGTTQIRRLDGKRLEAWLEEYSLGQLWEKNELGGRPSQEESAVRESTP